MTSCFAFRPLRRVTLVFVGVFPLLAAALLCAAENAAESEARLRQSVTYLASDALEGRGVGTDGLNMAADYLGAQFAQIGLRTDLFHGTPFQEFEVTVSAEMGPHEKNRLTFAGPPTDAGELRRIDLKLGEMFTPLATGGSGSFDAPLVFAGYGITAKNLKRGNEPFVYDDFGNIDAKGKVVIILRKEPQQKDKNSPFNGTQTTQHAYFTRKLTNAEDHGAAAVIFVNDGLELVSHREENAKLLKDALDKLAGLRDKLGPIPVADAAFEKLSAEVNKAASEAAELSKTLGANPDTLLPFAGAGDTSTHQKLPVYFCTRATIDELLRASAGKDLATLENEIDTDLAPRSVELKGWRATGEAHVLEQKVRVKNVVGVLDGEGPLADETIVLGAHYDHLGLGGAGSLAPWTREIHNGADDNASGTATLLEAAQRLAAMGHKPRRRIVFIAFTGEERGLLGSAHYTREPRFPLEKTIAMFNLDMVGRLNDDKLAVYGTGTAKEFDPLVERLCREHGFQLTKHAGGFGPSDQSSFYSKKIPVLHLFTGTHSDYHRPSDDAEKLNIAGMRRVADFLVDIVQATDAEEGRPTYVEIRRVESITGPVEGDRPSFGSMPAYPNPVKDGVLLEAVLEGTPADKAGIKGGDVLVKFGDNKVTILEDFEGALRQYKPGDKVKVTVRRGEQVIEAEVTLARRRAMP
jgi:peptidase M28-like protein/PDZ domain-containing protein/PA domain-containing protein